MPGNDWVLWTSNCRSPVSVCFHSPQAGATPSRRTLCSPTVGSGPTSTTFFTRIGRYSALVYFTLTGTLVDVTTGGGGGGGGNPGPGKKPPPKKLPTATSMGMPKALSRSA